MMPQQSQDTEWSPNETEPYGYEYGQTPAPTSQSQSQQIDKLVGALAKAQGAIVAPERNRTVTVIPKSGGRSYSFRYATISAIIDAIRKPLSDNELAYTQILSHDANGGFYKLTTLLMHSSGQYIGSEVPIIAEGGTNQQFGSALTYMKRYQLSALVGIAADEDDDGNAADSNDIQAIQERKPAIADSPIQDPKIIKDIVGDIALDAKIKVEFNPEEADEAKAHNWLKFGRDFMAAARAAKGLDAIVMLENANEMALRGMEKLAPKVYANMMLALLQVKTELNKKGVENG
jgi:ERF superfamily